MQIVKSIGQLINKTLDSLIQQILADYIDEYT